MNDLDKAIVSEKKKFNGAHDGGIPPGWDFPEARAAAKEGLDLWLLQTTLRRTPAQRLRDAAGAARLVNKLAKAGREKYGA